jgi:hypothetical protein
VKKYKRLSIYNFLYILYLDCIYYKTDLIKRLFIILYRLLSRLLYLEDYFINSALYMPLKIESRSFCYF